MERIISEWRVVETDDGFRIEIKGDKEALRGWLKHHPRHGPMRFARRMRFGPWGMGMGFGHGEWCCSEDEESEEEHEKS